MAESHGQSKASWTGTGIILLGTLLVGLGIVFAETWLWVIGVVGIVAGVVAWIAMEKAGLGERPASHTQGTGAVR